MSRTRWATEVPESDAFESFYKVPRVLIKKNLLKYASKPERLVFHALLAYRWSGSGLAFVGVAKLAASTGLNPTTVMKATKGLEAQGLIKKRGCTDQRVLRYELLPYGAEVPPVMGEIVMKRASKCERRPFGRPRDIKGRFRLQRPVVPVNGPRADPAQTSAATTPPAVDNRTPAAVESRTPAGMDTIEKQPRSTAEVTGVVESKESVEDAEVRREALDNGLIIV